MFSRNIVDVMAQNELTPWFWPKSSGDFYTETNYNFPSTLDGNPVVKTFDNFTIGPTAVVTTQNRCKGLYLNILGDCIIDGTLSMRARGAKGIGTNIGILPDVGILYSNNIDALLKHHVKQEDIIPAVGGAKNTSGTGRRTGGGRRRGKKRQPQLLRNSRNKFFWRFGWWWWRYRYIWKSLGI